VGTRYDHIAKDEGKLTAKQIIMASIYFISGDAASATAKAAWKAAYPKSNRVSRAMIVFLLPNVKTEPRPCLAQFVRKHEM